MPSRKPLLAVPAPMLHILQPTNAKRNTTQSRNHTDAQCPPTKPKRRKHNSNQLLVFSLSQRREKKGREKDVVKQPEKDSQCIPARHIPRLADRLLLAHRTPDRNGAISKRGFEIDIILRASRFGRWSGVFHRGGFHFDVGLGFDGV